MKKLMKILFVLFLAISITACRKDNDDEQKEKENKKVETAFYEMLPAPNEKIDKVDKNEKGKDKTEYIMYVDNYSYDKFYEYIMKLEKLGFHYDFVNDCVPDSIDKLYDKTETSWAANNGKIWVRASWRSNENPNYKDYNLQVIFNNYDYLVPLDEDSKVKETDKTE